ncbi:Glycerol-3-phosphate acyltransferase [compost metagenome]
MTGAIFHIVLKKVTDIVAIRSIILGVIIPLTCVIMRLPLPIIVTTTISGIILIYRHKGNIKQLFSKENI